VVSYTAGVEATALLEQDDVVTLLGETFFTGGQGSPMGKDTVQAGPERR
jgi:hypothetical protein